MREDCDGAFWDTVFDIVSLVVSIVEVIQDPTDSTAWLGLAGDVIDLIPGVTGVGEATRSLKIADNIGEAIDTADDIADTLDNGVDIAKIATSGTPNSIGKMGEQLAGIDPRAKTSILVNGRTRIPDALTPTTLIEVKNVKYISNTLQLRDFATYAKATGRSHVLYVRPTTKVAKTVRDAGWDIKYLW